MIRPILLALALASPVQAHDWYDPYCCSDADCAPVPVEAVSATDKGYLITLEPGDHPLVKASLTFLIEYDAIKLRRSMDGDYHVCLGANSMAVYCVYEPVIGF